MSALTRHCGGTWLLLVPLALAACGESRGGHEGSGPESGGSAADGGQSNAGASAAAAGAANAATAGAANTNAGTMNGGGAGANTGAGAANGGAGAAAGSAGAPNGGASAAAGSAGAAGGSAGSGAAGGGGSSLPPDVHDPTTPATCDPLVCRVVRDAEVSQHQAYSFLDFRLAASSDTTYLLLEASGTADQHSRLLALAADGEHAIDQGVVASMTSPVIAVDASGAPHVAGAVLDSNRTPTVEAQAWDGAAWSQTTVGVGLSSVAALELEAGSSGTPSLFWVDDTMAYWLSTESADGSWQRNALAGRADDYSLDTQGQPLLFSYGGTSYVVKDGGGSALVTVQVPDESPNASVEPRPAPAIPQPLPVGAPYFALVALHPDGLHLVLGGNRGGLLADVPLPDTALPPIDCPNDETIVADRTPGDTCASPCPVQASGLTPGGNPLMSAAYAVARTADGASWVSYVTEDIDGEVDYTVWCPPESGSCTCRPSRPSGSINWTLHVVRVTPDGSSSVEALSAPLAQYFDPNIGGEWGVRAHAFGDRVTVGVAIRASAADLSSGLRVMTLEATK